MLCCTEQNQQIAPSFGEPDDDDGNMFSPAREYNLRASESTQSEGSSSNLDILEHDDRRKRENKENIKNVVLEKRLKRASAKQEEYEKNKTSFCCW